MIKVNLHYPNGAVYSTQTVTVAEMLTALRSVANPATTPLFLLDEPKQGKVPLKILGEVLDTDVSQLSFQLAKVVELG